MSIYAAKTSVPVEKSRAEIERTLQRYGASAFMYGRDGDKAVIGFMLAQRQIRFVLPLPDRADVKFCRFRGEEWGRVLPQEQAHEKWEQACRSKWRALCLAIKAKLEAVDSKITTIDEEFLAHMVLPNGSTVGDWARPQIKEAYETKRMPAMLFLGEGK